VKFSFNASLKIEPIPQKGQGTDVNVNKGQPFTDFLPRIENINSKGENTVKINPIENIPAIVNNILQASLGCIDWIKKYLLLINDKML